MSCGCSADLEPARDCGESRSRMRLSALERGQRLARHAAECSIGKPKRTRPQPTLGAPPGAPEVGCVLEGRICRLFKIPQLINQNPHQQSPHGVTEHVSQPRPFPEKPGRLSPTGASSEVLGARGLEQRKLTFT